MKRHSILLLLAGIILLLFTQSCSQSGEQREVILRGKSISSNIISPIKTTFKHNVYKIGDTVWVYRQTMTIDGSVTWSPALGKSALNTWEAFVIEEDNDAMRDSTNLQPNLKLYEN